MASDNVHDPGVYPVALDLTGKRCLVVGGGRVGTAKVQRLLDAGAHARIVSPTLTPELTAFVASGRVEHRPQEYRPADLDGCALVIAATNDRALNHLIADDATAAGLLVNVVDDPGLSTFTVPSSVARGAITVAVSTGGASPVLARHLRTSIGRVVGEEWGDVAELLASTRDDLKAAFTDPGERADVVQRLLRSDLTDLVRDGDLDAARRRVDAALTDDLPGSVALVGAGPGDPDLLTVRGATLIGRAEVIVHDRLGTEAILPLAPADCELIDVGKAPGRHGMSQEAISALLVSLAQQGRQVVRLKGGDPFVFGRGGEEALALAAAGVRFEIVPGISSAIGAVGSAGIPVTHRGLAQTVTVASGHDDPTSAAAQARWQALATVPGTIVLLMAMSNLAAITATLIASGRSADEPACALHWATTTREQRVEATLGSIASACADAGVGNPAVVVIGAVVEVGRQIAGALAGAAATR